MSTITPESDLCSQATGSPQPHPARASSTEKREVVLFGGLQGAPVPSMERYAESLHDALPDVGWPARLVRGRTVSLPGPRAVQFAALEFSRHVMYRLAARRERADVYHVTDHSFGLLVEVLPAERTVVTCHDLMPWIVPGIYPRRLGRAVGLPLWERSVRAMARAGHIVCVSTRTRDDVIERLGVPPDHLSVVANGVSDAFYAFPRTARVESRAQFGFADDACIAIHVGSSAAYKNVEAVIRAVHALRTRGIRAELVKVGPLTEAQGALLADLGLTSSVHLYSDISDDVLCALYNSADAMLFPSRYEGFGLPALEAMKAGLPLVVSNTEALKEVTAGLVPSFDPDDAEGMAEAIGHIWEHRDNRESNTEGTRKTAEMYTWQRTASMIAKIYERLAG